MTITVRGIENSLGLLNNEIEQFEEQQLRATSLELLSDLKRATPVDQGYARNSWNIGYTEDFVDATDGQSGSSYIAPRNEATEIYITNGVDYINRLNEGSSRQAPSNFIEEAITANFGIFTGG